MMIFMYVNQLCTYVWIYTNVLKIIKKTIELISLDSIFRMGGERGGVVWGWFMGAVRGTVGLPWFANFNWNRYRHSTAIQIYVCVWEREREGEREGAPVLPLKLLPVTLNYQINLSRKLVSSRGTEDADGPNE